MRMIGSEHKQSLVTTVDSGIQSHLDALRRQVIEMNSSKEHINTPMGDTKIIFENKTLNKTMKRYSKQLKQSVQEANAIYS